MKNQILALLCALALAKAERVRLNSHGCPVDITGPYAKSCNKENRDSSVVYDDPKQAPAICAAPSSDSILVAHEHCNQFYQCWNGNPIALNCYGDLQYNPALEICDWPQHVECGARIVPEICDEEESNPDIAEAACSSVGSEDLQTVHQSCNKYYKCHEGRPITFKCPGNLLYNHVLGYCDCAENVDCGERGLPTEGEDSSEENNGNCDPSEAPTICAGEGSDGILVAHQNCNQFYKCTHGVPVALRCYGNLLFNPSSGHCDWPENVVCGDRVIPDPQSEEDNSGGNGGSEPGDGENGNGGTCNCNPGEAPAICAADGSEGTLVAHENCNQFYKCNGGNTVTLTCPAGLLYNPYKEVCDWPNNVNCGDRVIPEPQSEEDNSGGNGGSEPGDGENGGGDNGNVGTCNCNPGEAPAICAADGSEGTLVAHENCNQFYKCNGGNTVTITCPAGLLYNPYKEVCDWPNNVNCGDRVIPEPQSEEDNSGGNGGSEPGDGENGGGDNGNGGTCNCNPGEAPAICAADGSEGSLIAHENCNQFYICNGGNNVTLTCPTGLLYNPYKEVCDWPDNVNCGDRVIPEPQSEEDNSGGNGGSEPGDGENDSGENGNVGTCNCNPGEAPAICAADGSEGTLVAHENCNQFYKCNGGNTVTITCPAGLLYNPYKEVCDWPNNVNCGDRVIPEPQSEEDNSGGNGGSEPGDGENGGGDNGNGGTCNCNPGEAPAICAADGSEGSLIAHENCNQFYICNGGNNVTLTCPTGLLYNPYKEVCDWPDNVNCGDRVIPEPQSEEDNSGGNGGSEPGDGENDSGENGNVGTCNCNPGEAPAICAADGSEGTLVAHENCNQFYKCNGGNTVTITCPAGLLYNPYKEVCDWPNNVNCGDRVIPEPQSEEDNSGGNGGSEPGDGENGGGDNGNGGTCNCNPGEAPAICAADGSEGSLIAHENCNQFYICNGGNTVTLTCPTGLLYNPYKEVCDWPDNVNCGDRVIPAPQSEEDNSGGNGGSEPGDGENDSGENGNVGTCNCNPGEAPAICAADGSEGTLVAHENCNQFYKCNGGNTVTITCPAGLLYNPYKEVCDWPNNVNCGDRVIPEPQSEEDNSGGNGGSEPGDGENGGGDNGNGGTCNCNPGEAPAICAADGSEGSLIAHENCNQFYICNGGNNVTLTCPTGLLYNPYKEVCDWPDNVNCGDRVIPEPQSEEDNSGGNGGSEPGDGENDSGENGNVGTCNCNPGEAPAICAADGSEGTLVAHENCNQFYKCNGGNTVTITCPAGLLYNPYKEVCDWPNNVNCGDRVIPEPQSEEDNSGGNGGSEPGDGENGGGDNGNGGTCNCNPGEAPAICAADGSEGSLIAHENCNQFYICNGGNTVTLTCPTGLLYNPYKEVCDWPDNVNCGDRVIPAPQSEEDNSGGNGGSEPGDGENDSGENGNVGTCNCNPGEAPAICAANGSEGTLVAHENCNQFYKCNGGNTVTITCPAGLLYNPYKEVCDWPNNVNCGDRVIPEPQSEEDNSGGNGGSEPGDGENGGGDNGNGGTCNCNPGEAPAICAADGSEGSLIAHENCNQFYICNGGNTVTLTCPTGLLYNPYKEVCDWPDNVNCGDRVIPAPQSEEDNSGGNGGSEPGDGENDSGENGNVGTCNCNPGEAPAICAANGSEGTLVAHENCNQFYKCNGGNTVTITCPAGLLYNPYKEVCDWPDNVNCGDRVIPEPQSEEDNSGGNGGSEPGDAENGGGDNGNGGTCNCNPGEAPAICAADGSEGTLIAHENCNQFYICNGGNNVTLTCPTGLLYNPYKEVCDWPDNVNCGDRVIPEPQSEEDNSGGNGGSEPGDGENDSGENGNVGTCNCNPGEAPAICAANGSEGTLVAHENCNQFYKCNGGNTVTITCPAGLLYNPYKEVCDWPDNVNCGDRVIPEPQSEEDNSGGNGGSEPGDAENGGGDNGNGGTCNCNPGEAPAICAADGSEGSLISHENCNQFYICNGGNNVTLTCPTGLLYNPYKEVCDWPDNVNCGDRVIPEPQSEEDNSGGNGGSENGPGDGENGNGGTCNCNPGEAPAICAADGSEGTLVAHENCNQFYKCNGGNTVTITCPAGLLYNPYKEVCDWPDNVNCGDRVIPEPQSEEDNSGGNGGSDNEGSENGPDNGDNGNVGTCNCNPGEAPAICSAENSEGVLVAHENCNQFYTCNGGSPVTLTCPSGLLYNPYKEVCDWAENVNCGDRVIPDPDCEDDNSGGNGGSDNGGSENGPGNGDNGNVGTCNCNPGEAPAICSAENSEGVLVAHENCNQFYTCNGGSPVTLTCPSGLLYNPYKEVCDWAENVNCGDRVIPDPDCEDDNSGGNGGSDNGGSENGPGNGDNGNVGTCNCNPGEAPAICAAENSEGVLVAHENCNQFYMCNGGSPVALTCPSGLLYNPYKEVCDWAENVNCGDRVIPDPDCEDDNSGGNGGSDNGGSENGPGNGDNGNVGTCNCNPGEAPAICSAENSEGVLVAHENCNQFYTCNGGSPVTLTCPSGLLYNPYKEVCDWAENVNCGDRVIPDSDCEDDNSGGNGGSDNGGSENGPGNGDNGNVGTCNCNPGEAPAICAAENSEGVLVAHENCNQFYTCNGGSPVALTCPSGLFYNPYKEVCDWAENVNCGDRVIPDPDCEDDNESGSGSENDGSDAGSNEEASAHVFCANDGSDGYYLPHRNCHQFYTCIEKTPVTLTCVHGLFYDSSALQCDWPENVSCGDRLITITASLNKHFAARNALRNI